MPAKDNQARHQSKIQVSHESPLIPDSQSVTPFEEYTEDVHDLLWFGTGGERIEVEYTGRNGHGVYNIAFEGILGNLDALSTPTAPYTALNRR